MESFAFDNGSGSESRGESSESNLKAGSVRGFPLARYFDSSLLDPIGLPDSHLYGAIMSDRPSFRVVAVPALIAGGTPVPRFTSVGKVDFPYVGRFWTFGRRTLDS